MYGLELRTCGLGAVVAVLLGAGIGVGWDYFADSATGKTVAAAATSLAQQGASNSPLSCPPGPREGPVPDVPRLPAVSRPNNQPDTIHATGALRVTHAAHTSRTRRPDRPDGGERMTF
jgi:hypothetical protein